MCHLFHVITGAFLCLVGVFIRCVYVLYLLVWFCVHVCVIVSVCTCLFMCLDVFVFMRVCASLFMCGCGYLCVVFVCMCGLCACCV